MYVQTLQSSCACMVLSGNCNFSIVFWHQVVFTVVPDAFQHSHDFELFLQICILVLLFPYIHCSLCLFLHASLYTLNDVFSFQQSDLTLRFIFIDGEEAFRLWSDTDSLYGARHMAANLEARAFPTNNAVGTNELHRMVRWFSLVTSKA